MTTRPVSKSPISGILGWLWVPALLAAMVIVFPLAAGGVGLPRWAQYSTTLIPFALVVPLVLFLGAQWYRAQTSIDFALIAILIVTLQMNGIGVGPLDLFDLALLGFFGVWLAKVTTASGRAVRLSFLFFAASALVLLTFAHLVVMTPVPWFIGLFGIVRVTLLALIVVDLCRSLKMLQRISTVFVTVAAVSGAIGVIQFLLAYFNIYVFNFITPLESAYKPTPLGFVMRSSGLNSTAQHFSSFMIYALPFALWQLSMTWRMRDVLAVFLILGGLFVSLNFGGYFAAMGLMALFPLLRWPHLIMHFALVGGLLLGLAYFSGLLTLIYELSFGDAGIAKGIDQRKTLFMLGLEQIERAPWIGTGLTGFGGVDGNFWDRPVHNLFGQAATELGLLGLLCFLAIFGVLILQLIMQIHASDVPSRFPTILLLVMIAALQLAQTEPNLEHSNLWFVLALAQAVVLIGWAQAGDSDNQVGQRQKGEPDQPDTRRQQ